MIKLIKNSATYSIHITEDELIKIKGKEKVFAIVLSQKEAKELFLEYIKAVQ